MPRCATRGRGLLSFRTTACFTVLFDCVQRRHNKILVGVTWGVPPPNFLAVGAIASMESAPMLYSNYLLSCGIMCAKVDSRRDYTTDDAYGIRPDKVELYGQRRFPPRPRPGQFAGQAAGAAAGGAAAGGMGRGATAAILVFLFVAVAGIAALAISLAIQRTTIFYSSI